jgi:hypothetical protein
MAKRKKRDLRRRNNEGRDDRGLGTTNLYTILLRKEHDDDGGGTEYLNKGKYVYSLM